MNGESPGDDHKNWELTLLLEEYRVLRAEINQAIQAQHAAFTYGLASLAVLGLAIATAWEKAPALAALALMVVMPAAFLFLVATVGNELGRMRRAGTYLGRYLEPRINQRARIQHGLAWEGWLSGRVGRSSGRRRRATRRNSGIWTVGVMVLFFTVTSIAIGCYRFNQRAGEAKHIATANSLAKRTLKPGTKAYRQIGRTQAAFYYRHWHVPWSVEFWLEVVVFGLLPLGIAALMLWQGLRPVDMRGWPPYKPPQES